MEKMWTGRTAGLTDAVADDFNSSIRFDCKMFEQDITGSMAHAAMLGAQHIITENEAQTLIDGLSEILDDLKSGKLAFDMQCEDIHIFVEQELTKRLGDVGKKLHTARSRNDQVALDMRLYLRDKTGEIGEAVQKLIRAICTQAESHKATVLPGYTHLQRAQPITFGHHLMAYAMMLLRDLGRLADCKKRMNVSPIGSCALAGTTYDTDRFFEARQLGFDAVCQNSIDGVSDRDFCAELLGALSILMMHLSRMAEEIILWCSWEFRFVELSDAYTTGSSIMPQKKNPDMAELIRGKTGRVYGDLLALLTTLKGLPLAYNKDMQEDKPPVFDASDTLKASLSIFTEMISTVTFNKDRMKAAVKNGFMNATDAADYLVSKGIPFRDCHEIIGRLVLYCINENTAIEDLSLETLKTFSDKFEADIYENIDPAACIKAKLSAGSTSFESVKKQLDDIN